MQASPFSVNSVLFFWNLLSASTFFAAGAEFAECSLHKVTEESSSEAFKGYAVNCYRLVIVGSGQDSVS